MVLTRTVEGKRKRIHRAVAAAAIALAAGAAPQTYTLEADARDALQACNGPTRALFVSAQDQEIGAWMERLSAAFVAEAACACRAHKAPALAGRPSLAQARHTACVRGITPALH